MKNVLLIAADQIDDLVRNFFGICARQVDLVQNRNDLQVVLKREVEIRDGLRLYSLGSVNDQKCAFTCGNGTRDLVAEIYMARGVDEVEHIIFAIGMYEVHLYGMALNGDPALALQIHIVQKLILLLAFGDGLGVL